MSVFAITFGTIYDRDKSEAAGIAERGAARTVTLRGLVSAALPDGSGRTGIVLAGLTYAEILTARIRVIAGVGTGVELTAELGDTSWLVTNGLGATLLLDNGGQPAILLALALTPGGPLTPTPAIVFAGTTFATAFGSAGAIVDVTLEVAPFGAAERISHARAVAFADSAKGDALPAVAGLIGRLEDWFNGAGGGRALLGVGSSGEVFAQNAAMALPSPAAAVWIPPSDIGNQPEQLPVDVAANTVQHYGFHPGAFFRETTYTRAWRREPTHPALLDPMADPGEQLPITQLGGALFINTIVRAPTHSRWLIIVDSSAVEVVIAHPVGSDLRRPRDIWNQVWFAFLTQNAYQRSVPTFTPQADGSFARTGSINRVRYLEYARFLEPLDSNRQEPIVVPYFQGPIVPPGPPPPPP